MSFFEELKRRNVFRVGVAYLVASWVLLQVADLVLEAIDAPEWVLQAMMMMVALGFVVALIIAWAYELTPEGIKRERDVDRERSITHETANRLNRITIGLVIAAVVIVAADRLIPEKAPDAPSPENTAVEVVVESTPVEPPEEPETIDEASIAVLPFVNMSDDASNEYFSDGISEEILNALAKVKELKVAGRTSSFAFKGKGQDLRVIGEALGVNHILEGSVRKAGNQVRITAQLIRADNGFHLWSEAYDRELTNVFAIQDEISGAILEQLKLQLLDTEKSAMVTTSTDTRAYEQYLLAKQRIYDRNKLSLEAAQKLLDSAIAIDPDYAPAHAQRAITTLLLVEDQYGDIPREESQSRAKEILDRTLLMDPGLAEAWAALGLYYLGEPSSHNEAIEALERALSINPNLIDASNWLQIAYGSAGETGKVLPILEDMLERDPLYRPVIGNAILEYNRLGMQQKSLAIIERARPFIPDDAHLLAYKARTLLTLGRSGEALLLAEEAVRRQPTDAIFKLTLGTALFDTYQYDRILDAGLNEFWRTFMLDILGRKEEAAIMANTLAEQGFPGPLFGVLIRSGRFSEMVSYIEERWADLDAYEEAFPHGDEGYGMMGSVAFAYLKTGHDEKFRDAMARVRKAHDQLISEGVQANGFYWGEAAYYTLAGDLDKALEQLAIAIELGAVATPRITDSNPIFEPLEGDPRFEAIQSDMVNHINTQRSELGLEPVST